MDINNHFVHKRKSSDNYQDVVKKDAKDYDLEQENFKLEHWDAVIWMGDMNYRIQCSGPEVVYRLVATDQWDLLTMNDQLLIEKRIERVGHGFREGNITFAPTFKFNTKQT